MARSAKCHYFQGFIVIWVMFFKSLRCSTNLATGSNRNVSGIIFCIYPFRMLNAILLVPFIDILTKPLSFLSSLLQHFISVFCVVLPSILDTLNAVFFMVFTIIRSAFYSMFRFISPLIFPMPAQYFVSMFFSVLLRVRAHGFEYTAIKFKKFIAVLPS